MEIRNVSQNPIFNPLFASENLNGGMQSREEFQDVWNSFDRLTEEKKALIGSREMAEALQKMQVQYGMQDDLIEGISVLIRHLLFERIPAAGLSSELELLFQGSSFAKKGQEIASAIQRDILTLKVQPPKPDPAQESSPLEASTASLPLLQAMAKHQNLGNQMLSEERIRLKSQLDPVRGSLFNWLKYYRDELGIGRHSSVERGQFLFRSENGRKLHPDEREKVNLVLKSLEENLPLQIDTVRQEIIFPKFEFEQAGKAAPAAAPNLVFQPSKNAQVQVPPQPPAAPSGFANGQLGVKKPIPEAPLPQAGGSMSFSFNHILPAEQEGAKKTEAPAAAPVKPPVPKEPPLAPAKKSRFHIRPVSLTYGDDENEKAL